MDVTKAPAIDPNAMRAGAATGAQAPEVTLADTAAVPVDRVDIQPLDAMGALQILIAEVRAELSLPADATGPELGGAPAAPGAGPTPAPQAMVLMFLRALPEEDVNRPAAWLTAITQTQASLFLALDKGVAVVSAWRNVAAAVLDAAKEMRTMVTGALSDEAPNPLWLRPEWLGLEPRMRLFWQRRRRAGRKLTDPDFTLLGREPSPEDDQSAGR